MSNYFKKCGFGEFDDVGQIVMYSAKFRNCKISTWTSTKFCKLHILLNPFLNFHNNFRINIEVHFDEKYKFWFFQTFNTFMIKYFYYLIIPIEMFSFHWRISGSVIFFIFKNSSVSLFEWFCSLLIIVKTL